jgi:hypothetical protein
MGTLERLPSSAQQVYGNSDIQQALLLLAQNNVLINIPEATTREFEKSEIDQKCREIKEPVWSEKLSVYLNEFRKRPELLDRFNIIEMKRGDKADVKIQKDLDGAVTLSVQFVKIENYGKVSFQTKLPCNGSVAEYLGRELVKTDFDFPNLEKFVLALQSLPAKKDLPRFQFSSQFLSYLAERGAILKFSHEMSFEKTAQGKFVMVELLNKLAEEVKQPFHQHINYWFKQINTQSTQAHLVQMFALLQDKELKAGVRVDLKSESSVKIAGESDLTFLFMTYNLENDQVNAVNLQQLEKCLQGFTEVMSGIKLRKPAAQEKESYLRPGYSCLIAK